MLSLAGCIMQVLAKNQLNPKYVSMGYDVLYCARDAKKETSIGLSLLNCFKLKTRCNLITEKIIKWIFIDVQSAWVHLVIINYRSPLRYFSGLSKIIHTCLEFKLLTLQCSSGLSKYPILFPACWPFENMYKSKGGILLDCTNSLFRDVNCRRIHMGRFRCQFLVMSSKTLLAFSAFSWILLSFSHSGIFDWMYL